MSMKHSWWQKHDQWKEVDRQKRDIPLETVQINSMKSQF